MENQAVKVGGGVFSLQFLFMDTQRLAVAYLRMEDRQKVQAKYPTQPDCHKVPNTGR